MKSTDDYYLSFQSCPGIGPKTFETILKAFDNDVQQAWESKEQEWRQLGFSQKIITAIFEHKQQFDFDQLKQTLSQNEVHYISRENNLFPTLLKQISSCPIGLFVKGVLEIHDQKAIAVVGTRKITTYGREVTQRFVDNLTRLGFTIVSGLARGVDGVAHKAALDAGGRTIAVLGNGLDTIYPPEHAALAAGICRHGALLSEYLPGSPLAPGNFPARNRIVSGMSLGVLVTEGASRSGSKITAMAALEQNREVFAVPGPITNPMSSTPAQLIQAGAKLVVSERDILTELQIPELEEREGHRPSPTNGEINLSDPYQQAIWQYLINGTQHIDEIVRHVKLPAPTVTTSLSMLEIQGLVKHLGNGNYMVV